MDNTVTHSLNYSGIRNQFWADETPQIFSTRTNVLRFYKKSGIISVSAPDFPDRKSGEMRIGKTVCLQIQPLIEKPDTLNALIDILCNVRDQIPQQTK